MLMNCSVNLLSSALTVYCHEGSGQKLSIHHIVCHIVVSANRIEFLTRTNNKLRADMHGELIPRKAGPAVLLLILVELKSTGLFSFVDSLATQLDWPHSN